MRTICRRCGSAAYPLTPVGYCYLCFSRFGSTTQIAMLLMAYNPYLSIEELQHCLGFDTRATTEMICNPVRALLDEEIKQDGLVLQDRRIHTRKRVICATVHLRHLGATVGAVKINEEMRPVYVVPGTNSRQWATSESHALHLGKRRR
jgi:hypothetical protein